MLPNGYVGLVVADTRRALQWEAGLRAEGIESVRVETSGSDVDKGDWQIGVPRGSERAARRVVTSVLNGERHLPSAPLLSPTASRALLAIAVLLTITIVVAALSA